MKSNPRDDGRREMAKYTLSKQEKEFLKTYDITAFDRPSVTTDVAAFAVMDELAAQAPSDRNYRKDPVRELQLLLVKRGGYPFKGKWALPGGFSKKQESTHETALRELEEETGVGDAYLRPFGVFGKPDRDPRGWIISHGYLALIDGGKYRLHAGADAWEAAWFRLSVECEETSKKSKNGMTVVERIYTLHFYQAERDLKFDAKVCESMRFSELHGNMDYEVVDMGELAFDHAEIILNAWQCLRSEAEGSGKIVFDLMPERFTLNALQQAFELVLGRKLLVANFRRKIAPLVIETEEEITGVGHRPAKLYRRNLEEFFERN